jgi:uncharacterized protein (DUF433 family)
MDWQDRITVDPKVLVGKPVIRGTRLAVAFLMELLAEGWTQEQILQNYPQLTAEDIQTVLHYAAEALKEDAYDDSPWTRKELQALAWEAGKAMGWEDKPSSGAT